MLSKEILHEYFDYKDGELYWKKTTSFRVKVGQKAGTPNKNGYIQIRLNNVIGYAHRFIFLMHYGYLPEEIDHIKGKANNIENLRAATHAENMKNVKLLNTNKTGVKGVHWCNARKKYVAQLDVNGKHLNLGRHKTLEEAKKVITEARKKHHGEYANHG